MYTGVLLEFVREIGKCNNYQFEMFSTRCSVCTLILRLRMMFLFAYARWIERFV